MIALQAGVIAPRREPGGFHLEQEGGLWNNHRVSLAAMTAGPSFGARPSGFHANGATEAASGPIFEQPAGAASGGRKQVRPNAPTRRFRRRFPP